MTYQSYAKKALIGATLVGAIALSGGNTYAAENNSHPASYDVVTFEQVIQSNPDKHEGGFFMKRRAGGPISYLHLESPSQTGGVPHRMYGGREANFLLYPTTQGYVGLVDEDRDGTWDKLINAGSESISAAQKTMFKAYKKNELTPLSSDYLSVVSDVVEDSNLYVRAFAGESSFSDSARVFTDSVRGEVLKRGVEVTKKTGWFDGEVNKIATTLDRGYGALQRTDFYSGTSLEHQDFNFLLREIKTPTADSLGEYYAAFDGNNDGLLESTLTFESNSFEKAEKKALLSLKRNKMTPVASEKISSLGEFYATWMESSGAFGNLSETPSTPQETISVASNAATASNVVDYVPSAAELSTDSSEHSMPTQSAVTATQSNELTRSIATPSNDLLETVIRKPVEAAPIRTVPSVVSTGPSDAPVKSAKEQYSYGLGGLVDSTHVRVGKGVATVYEFSSDIDSNVGPHLRVAWDSDRNGLYETSKGDFISANIPLMGDSSQEAQSLKQLFAARAKNGMTVREAGQRIEPYRPDDRVTLDAIGVNFVNDCVIPGNVAVGSTAAREVYAGVKQPVMRLYVRPTSIDSKIKEPFVCSIPQKIIAEKGDTLTCIAREKLGLRELSNSWVYSVTQPKIFQEGVTFDPIFPDTLKADPKNPGRLIRGQDRLGDVIYPGDVIPAGVEPCELFPSN